MSQFMNLNRFILGGQYVKTNMPDMWKKIGRI